jgi:hypothetical protein
MSAKITPEVLEAAEVYRSGRKAEAFRMLKESSNMSLPEAKELMVSLASKMAMDGEQRAEDEGAVKEALDAVELFDELTILMLRHMRDTKQQIGTGNPVNAPACAAGIYTLLANMIAADVNPCRVMAAHILSGTEEREAAVIDAAKHSLRNDLVHLI